MSTSRDVEIVDSYPTASRLHDWSLFLSLSEKESLSLTRTAPLNWGQLTINSVSIKLGWDFVGILSVRDKDDKNGEHFVWQGLFCSLFKEREKEGRDRE